ncbi:MAG: bifunctional (p)ppGpp synthetase/guanosine-3',5'-bis(diphosphate) 3'-pyrophosphohydrolase [Firmicutes bacterium]|nr:bifunctional (p)ppGpp synthetase/guanosine-3',5'-bis(diphosphate) 3'-pyrophosphohydrolase [Bacillota bacterium]
MSKEFLKKCAQFYKGEQLKVIENAFKHASAFHAEGPPRFSGEPYIIHPIAVANILIDLGLDHSSIAAALLHDVLEDTPATEETLKELVGEEITSLVMGVTKLDGITFTSKLEEQAENFSKMFVAMANDIRVILIKICDRLHNMRTLKYLTNEKQKAMAQETLDIYVPLASRLGLSYIKSELEDLGLKYLRPDVYEELTKEIAMHREERQGQVDKIAVELKKMLDELGIKGEISGRPKHFFSIYKKIVKQNKTVEEIYDLTAMRVIVKTTDDCYSMLGKIHSRWTPLPGRVKDYIAVPKPNNYQSLHTTVMPGKLLERPFEIQIRTADMHKIAEFGVAAHWKYKEAKKKESAQKNIAYEERLKWLRGVLSDTEGLSSSKEFYESFKFDLMPDQVFIFTPRGDVKILPEGSTPIDFAYSVHSEIGNKCTGAKINSKMVPLSTKLKTGDYVEIITSATSKGPSRDWLKIVKTTGAKSKINLFFKKTMKEEHIKLGKSMFEDEAKRKGYSVSDLLKPKHLDIIKKRYALSSLDDMYALIGFGELTVGKILPKLIEEHNKENKVQVVTDKIVETTKKTSSGGVIIDGYDDILIRLARCCTPVPGDNIMGFVSRGKGVAIHRATCQNIQYAEQFRLIDAKWARQPSEEFIVTFCVETKNSEGVIAKIASLLYELKLSITNMEAKVVKNQMGQIRFSIWIKSTKQVDLVIKKIKQLNDIEKIYRV